MTTILETLFQKAVAEAAKAESEEPNLPDDENVYAYFPTGAKTPRHKKNFEKIFRDWARAVRTGGDPTEMSHRLTDANPGNPTGEDHAPFAFQIQIMFDPQTRQRIINAVKKGAFVRFHIRSPSGKKMWLEV